LRSEQGLAISSGDDYRELEKASRSSAHFDEGGGQQVLPQGAADELLGLTLQDLELTVAASVSESDGPFSNLAGGCY